MSGLFGGRKKAPIQAEKDAEAAQNRAEERATAQERTEMQGAQGRRRLRRSGGMKLLFSPARTEGPQQTKLGGGE
tara:strand:- start:191 stop:415 length:225 start_codon:yes stop_codon:yes gene_type:complete